MCETGFFKSNGNRLAYSYAAAQQGPRTRGVAFVHAGFHRDAIPRQAGIVDRLSYLIAQFLRLSLCHDHIIRDTVLFVQYPFRARLET